MSDNSEPSSLRPILLLEQVLSVAAAIIPGLGSTLRPALPSFTKNPSPENPQNGMEFLEMIHFLARGCAQNCFLSLDVASYDPQFRKSLASLINYYVENLPPQQKYAAATLGEMLETTGIKSFEPWCSSSLRAFNRKDSLFLRVRKDDTFHPIAISGYPNQEEMTLMTVAAIAGFGQQATYVNDDLRIWLDQTFGVAATDGGRKFLTHLKNMTSACHEELRDSLAQQIGIGTQMEQQLKSVIQRHPQQLFLFNELSKTIHSPIGDLCATLGTKIQDSLQGEITQPLTALLATGVLRIKYRLQFNNGNLAEISPEEVLMACPGHAEKDLIFIALQNYVKQQKASEITTKGEGGSLSDLRGSNNGQQLG